MRQSFLKVPPKDDYEEYAGRAINCPYFLVLNKIDELDGTNERLLNITRRILKNNVRYDIIIVSKPIKEELLLDFLVQLKKLSSSKNNLRKV